LARSLDPSRLITAAINKQFDNCYLSQFLDVIMLNRYVGWYSNGGKLELVKGQLNHEFDMFHSRFNGNLLSIKKIIKSYLLNIK
jgi:hypothetical protein